MNYINFVEKHHLIRHETFSLTEFKKLIFDKMLDEDTWIRLKTTEKQKYRNYKFGKYTVNIATHKMVLFKKQTVCACCGLEGQFFALESFSYKPFLLKKGNPKLFFNLYGIKDNHEILFNIDHIIPQSKGGKSCQSNYQTLCYYCNIEKGDKEIKY